MTEFPDDVNTVPAEDGSTTWVEIASTGNEDEAKLMQGFFHAEGISAQVESVEMSMAPTTFGNLGDIRVYVPAADEARAQELLRQRNEAYERLDDDGETVVTDEGPMTLDEASQVEPDGGSNTSNA
ncbi:MAG TPA: DUF2007 domain-containing protein [Thermoanaerobaculia bacterium]|jgi:hypothetical protein